MEWINRHWCPDDTILKSMVEQLHKALATGPAPIAPDSSQEEKEAPAQSAKEQADEEERLQDEAAAGQTAKEKAEDEKPSRDDTAEAQKAKEKAQEDKRLQDEALEAQKAQKRRKKTSACRTKP